MLSALLAASLTLLPATGQEQDQDQGPDLKRVFEVAALLRERLEKGTPEEQREALTLAAEVPHGEIASVLELYARADDSGVRLAALEVLRWMEIPEALEALHDLCGKHRFPRDEAWHEAVIKGIGQHASKDSIEVLLGSQPSFKNPAAVRAQILALGRIRHRRSVEGLLELMSRFGKHRDDYIGEFRLSLVVLTGEDMGTDLPAWLRWWETASQRFRVADTFSLPPAQMKRWARYWGLADPEDDHDG